MYPRRHQIGSVLLSRRTTTSRETFCRNRLSDPQIGFHTEFIAMANARHPVCTDRIPDLAGISRRGSFPPPPEVGAPARRQKRTPLSSFDYRTPVPKSYSP